MWKNKSFWVVLLMILALSVRFIDVLPNFSAFLAVTVFGTALLKNNKFGMILPIILIYASDFIINNTVGRVYFPHQEGIIWFDNYMVWNGLAYLIVAIVSSLTFGKFSFIKGLIYTLCASVAFFLITNVGAWLDPKLGYPADISGLMTSFSAALPFFRTSILSDLGFATLLFGTYHFAFHQSLESKKVPSEVL